MELDYQNLVIINNTEEIKNEEDVNTMILECVKQIQTKIKTFPSNRKKTDLIYKLPASTIRLPQAEEIKPKEKTTWEKFAEMKGIKKKKGRLVWDNELQKYIPRYGKGSRKMMEKISGVKELDVPKNQ
ncbi:Ribosome biogenesis regulatory like protein [Astathelohania contejeani]|uniref:Ribosome biogenesis regulatory protein n=1 Tax=Astathelohania contejeani TaxID=164912 RepID=A0ABQ7I2R3_9MICR|nr:Ribosome biogenesis regulatory like protein [Thelohania contejeani]